MRTKENITELFQNFINNQKDGIFRDSIRENFERFTDMRLIPQKEIQPGTSVFLLEGKIHGVSCDDNLKYDLCKRIESETKATCIFIDERLVIFNNLPAGIYEEADAAFLGWLIEEGEENIFTFKAFEKGEPFKKRMILFQKKTGIKLHLEGDICKLYINETVDAETLEKEEQEALEAKANAEAQAEAAKTVQKKEYARNCGKLSRKYKVAFINVLRIGDDEKIVKAHADSIKAAQEQLKAMTSVKREELYHELFVCGRARKQKVLDELGVYVGGADVNHMNFSLLNID